MKIQTRFAFMLIFFMTVVAVAAELDFPKEVPSAVNKTTWQYKVLSALVFDIDKLFTDSGIKIESCSYTDSSSQKTTYYPGAGNCLQKIIFFESFYLKNYKPVTFLWVRDANGKLVPVRLQWIPNEEGWFSTAKELFSLQTESLSKWMEKNQTPSGDGMETTSFKKNFLGKINLTFPPQTYLADLFFSKGAVADIIKMTQIRQLAFEMNPIGKISKEIHYEGKLILYRDGGNPGDQFTEIDFSTNLNLLKTNRAFWLKGNSFQNFSSKEKLP